MKGKRSDRGRAGTMVEVWPGEGSNGPCKGCSSTASPIEARQGGVELDWSRWLRTASRWAVQHRHTGTGHFKLRLHSK